MRGRGFTLVELLIVLVVAAAVAALAAPRFGASAARYRVESAARRVAADLEAARGLAEAASSSRAVQFSTASGKYRTQGVQAARGGSAQVDLTAEPYRAAIRRASFGGSSTVTFDGYGAPASGGDVVVSSGDTAACRVLVLSGSGRVVVGPVFRLRKTDTPAAPSAAQLGGNFGAAGAADVRGIQ